jgi:hypothetical protein
MRPFHIIADEFRKRKGEAAPSSSYFCPSMWRALVGDGKRAWLKLAALELGALAHDF